MKFRFLYPYFKLLLAGAILSGCGGWFVRQPVSIPAARALVSRGDKAYARLNYRGAFEAYRKAEALGERSAILFYRLDLLGEYLSPRRGRRSPFRNETARLMKKIYDGGKTKRPAVFFYLAQIRGAEGDGKETTRLFAEAIRKFEKNEFRLLGAGEHELMARMYLALGLERPAEELLLKSRDLDPRYALTAYALGKLYRRAGRHRAALGQFARLVGLAPDDAEGHILLGYSAFDSGEYNRAKGAFQTALALDSTNGDARAGYQRADRAVARQAQLKKNSRELVWKVGFRSPLTPLTLPTDGLELRDASLGAPSFGPGGNLSLTSGKGDRYQIYTLSGDGMRLDWRAASSSGYSGFAGDPERFLVAVGSGRGRKIIAYDSVRKTSRKLHRGYCEQPRFSEKARAVLCVGPQGVVLVNLDTDRKSTIYREEGGRHPRFSRDGARVVLADGDSVVWLDRSGLELGRVRLDGGRSSASHPAFSPDGRWIVSGERGLYLTSLEEKSAIPLDNPFLKDGRRAVFSPDGRALVFETGGRLYRLELPRRMESFFSFYRSAALVQKGKFAESVRLLRGRPPEDRRLSAYYLLLGRSLFGLKFYQKAESAALRAAKLDIQDWRPILLLGNLKARQGMLDVSARLMDRAVELGPDQFDGYFYRARIRGLQGRDQEAIEDYRIALERLGSAGAREGEEAMMGLLDLYVKKERINDALLLLLENAEWLSRKAIRRIRMGPRYRALQEDPRFEEVMAAAPPLPAEKGGFLARRSSAALPENSPGEVMLIEVGAPGGARLLPRGAWGLKNKELGVHVFW